MSVRAHDLRRFSAPLPSTRAGGLTLLAGKMLARLRASGELPHLRAPVAAPPS